MAKLAGGLLRLTATFFYFLDFLCAAAILGIYSYFIAKLNYHDIYISKDWRAVEGLSGAAVLYTIFAVILTCFLGGITFFAFAGLLLDLLFMGCMIAIAVLVRGGARTCNGPNTTTPLGNGNIHTTGPAGTNLGVACKLNLAVLILACIGAFLFFISALLQLAVNRHHKKEQKYGPSPDNDYTSGSGKRRFWVRKPKTAPAYVADEAEMGTVPVPATGLVVADRGVDMRPSHDTAYTGTTMGQEAPVNKYEVPAPVVAAPPVVQEPVRTGPNIVSSTTSTRDAYYDPYARPSTTGPNGFVAPGTEYRYESGRPVDSATNY